MNKLLRNKRIALSVVCSFFMILMFSFFLYSCGGGGGNGNSSSLDNELRAIILEQGLTGDPSAGRSIPDIEDPLPQLGMKLFYTKALSGNKDAACVTCHHPMLGGSDRLSIPLGTGADIPDMLGPGRKDSTLGPIHPRHSPTTFNLALWDQVLFFDGRVESLGKTPGANGGDSLGIRTPDTPFGVADPAVGNNLVEAQAGFPVTSESELRGFLFEQGNDNNSVRTHLAARIGNYGIGQGDLVNNNWLTEFQAAFQSSEGAETLITFPNIAKAIAAYERSQVFVNNPWKAYVKGDNNAISYSAKRGALLFFRSIDQGGADCAECHSGDFFTDEQYHVIAVPQIGFGKGDSLTQDDDFGRFRETSNPDDMYAFRTPSLLNIEVTGPYGHVGSYTTLEGMVRHLLNPEEAFENYDYMQLDPDIRTINTNTNTRKALAKLEENRIAGIPSLINITLADEQVNDIINFLLTLTDPCVHNRSCLEKWIPDETDANPDGLRLDGFDKDGNFL